MKIAGAPLGKGPTSLRLEKPVTALVRHDLDQDLTDSYD